MICGDFSICGVWGWPSYIRVLRLGHILHGSHSEWKIWKKWEGIFQSGKSQGILNRLEKSENHTKYWKIQGISDKFYLLFLVIFK